MSSINFTCPHCSFSKQLPASAEGMQGNCPSCKAVVTIRADAPANPSISPQQQPVQQQPVQQQPVQQQPVQQQPLPQQDFPQQDFPQQRPRQNSQTRDRSGNKNSLLIAVSAGGIVILLIAVSLFFMLGVNRNTNIGINGNTNNDRTNEVASNGSSQRTTSVTQEPQPEPQPEPVDPVASFMKLVDLVPTQLGETWWKLVEPTAFASGDVSTNNVLTNKFDDGGGTVTRVRLHNHDFDFASNSGSISLSADKTFFSTGAYFNREYKCTFYIANGKWKIMKVEWGQVHNKPLEDVQMKATKRPDLLQFFEGLLEVAR